MNRNRGRRFTDSYACGLSDGKGRSSVELDPIGTGWAGVSPGEIEVGCIVHPTNWNRGIATEATRLATEDCFSRVGLDRLVALTTTANLASLRALEKLGMSHCGAIQHEDDPHDVRAVRADPSRFPAVGSPDRAPLLSGCT